MIIRQRLVASRSMRYNTRQLVAGDHFEARKSDARLLIALGRATSAERPDADVPEIPEDLKRKIASPPPVIETLHGSDSFDSVYKIGETEIQLGTIVANAHKASGLTVEQWNELPADARDALLSDELKRLQDEAAKPSTEEEPEETEDSEKTEEPETPPAEVPVATGDIQEARARYLEIVGRRAYAGWDVEAINAKIIEFQNKK